MDETAIKDTLVQWAAENLLSQATLSEDGAWLRLGDVTIPANASVTIQHAEKACTYAVASVYLQIIDPDQGLLAYRNACKRYGCDPVKALDKPVVVGYFFPPRAAVAAAPTAPAAAVEPRPLDGAPAVQPASDAAAPPKFLADGAQPPEAAQQPTSALAPDDSGATAASGTSTEAPAATRDRSERSSSSKHDRKHRGSKDKHRDDRHRRSSKDLEHDRKHKREKHGRGEHGSASAKRKKKARIVTNEQLFSNLSMVVDKRKLEQKAQEEIARALSAEGFQVTPDILENYKEATQVLLANEIPVGNSASILRASNPKKNLSRALELYLETVNPSKSGKGAKPGQGRSSSQQSSVPTTAVRTYLIGKKPVIVVPKGMTSPITLLNAHEFLCNGRFVPRDVMLKQVGGGGSAGAARAPTTFTRKVRGSSAVGGSASSSVAAAATGLLEFEIMDNPKKLGNNPKEWERIVAVIVMGQAWQFKDWPAPYNTPVHLFSRTLGFYIGMEGDKIPAEISGWAVKQGKLNRDKRGFDSVTLASFWNALEEFMAVHRSELLPQQDL